jgi:hypothetical protein
MVAQSLLDGEGKGEMQCSAAALCDRAVLCVCISLSFFLSSDLYVSA